MKLNFKSDAGYAGHGALGLIVLETDETVEAELREVMRATGNSLYHSRIPFAQTVTEDTLLSMAIDIPAAAGLLSQNIPFKAIGYGCTSAATLIGSKRVASLVQSKHRDVAVSEPISAIVAAAKAMNVTRIGFLTPYRPGVSATMRARLEAEGFEVTRFASFEEEDDHAVALISEESVLEGMKYVGEGCDMVFSACTNLRSFGVITAAETALDVPVVSSNSALAWHMLRLSGSKFDDQHFGRLFSYHLK